MYKEFSFMNGYLKLWIHNYEDKTGELYAKVAVDDFSGLGHACFDLGDLNERAKKFDQFPLSTDSPACISGGYWTKDAKKIREEHLHISAYPINQRGDINLLVKLAKPHEENHRSGVRHYVSVVLNTNYEQLSEFSKKLSLLACGEIHELIFKESE